MEKLKNLTFLGQQVFAPQNRSHETESEHSEATPEVLIAAF